VITKLYRVVSPSHLEEFYETLDNTNKDSVIVKLKVGAVCKADIRYFLGKRDPKTLSLKYPVNPLHEALGTVVKDYSGLFKHGQEVVLLPNYVDASNCNNCKEINCKNKDLGENYCPMAYFASSNSRGFLREYALINKNNLLPIDNIDYKAAIFTELLSIVSTMLRRVSIKKEDSIAVFGDGILGYLTYITISTLYKKNNLVVVGTNKEKLSKFTKAKIYTTEQTEELKKENISLAFECVGGVFASNAINQIIDICLLGTTIILGGVSEELVPLNTRKILEKGIVIKGVTRSKREDFVFALDIVKKNQETLKNLVLSEIHLENINSLYTLFNLESSNTKIGKNILLFL